MRRKQSGFIGDGDIAAMFALLVVIGIVIGVALSIGVPWLWGFFKPWIHALTA